MSKDSSEKYLDNLLNSISGEAFDDDSSFEGVDATSDDEFLKMFENELESEDYSSYISDFEMELEAGKDSNAQEAELDDEDDNEMSLDEVLAHVENQSENSELTDGIEAIDSENIPEMSESQVQTDVEDDTEIGSLDDLNLAVESFGESEEEPAVIGEPELEMTEIGEPDLAGNADAALEDMLGDELSELGDILSGDGIENPEGDEFDNFAEKEMQKNVISISEPGLESEAVGDDAAPKKKMGFFARIIAALFKSADDEDETNPKATAGHDAELSSLSDENAQILKELEGDSSGDKDKKKKEKKAKKEKPKKEPKPKKEKPKKEPKPKKEKKPKEKDNTPPLPKGPVIMIWIMVGSLFALVMLATNLGRYKTNISAAKNLSAEGDYIGAYKQLEGVEIKEEDQELYNKLRILSAVESEYDAYQIFIQYDKQLEAFDSLVCAAGRYNHYLEEADVLSCSDELEAIGDKIKGELKDKYNLTIEEIIDIYSITKRSDYTIAIYKKLTQLGIKY